MMLTLNRVHIGDARELATQLAPGSVQTIVTSPPYFGLRSYLPADHPDKAREMGSEQTPDEFVAQLVALFAALRPALRDDGTLWLNLGDSYAGGGNGGGGSFAKDGIRCALPGTDKNVRTRFGKQSVPDGCKPKDLIGIPWLVAFALRADGWYLRSDIIWHKPNPMPESVTDRPTRAHEYLFLLSKGPRYFYDAEAIAEPLADKRTPISWEERKLFGAGTGSLVIGHSASNPRGVSHNLGYDKDTRNKRSVWNVSTQPYPDAHFATFPPELIRPCIRAGCPAGGVVLDPFAGSGTVAEVCVEEGRNWLAFDLDERSIGWHDGRLRALPVASLFATGGAA